MLTRLCLQNFKCWQDTGDIPLKPITGIFGTNSSGKTSLIQALLLLKQTTESRDRGLVFDFGNRNTLVDLGDFESVIYGHDTSRALRISIDWHPQGNLQYWGGSLDQARRDAEFDYRYGFEVDIRKRIDEPLKPLLVERMAYRAGEAVFGMLRQDNGDYTIFNEGTNYLGRRENQDRPISPPIKCYGFPEQLREDYSLEESIFNLEFGLEKRLRRVYYLGPLRTYPQRIYSWPGTRPEDMGPAGEFVVSAILASWENDEETEQVEGQGSHSLTLEQYVAYWLKEIGLIHDFRVVPLVEGRQLFEVRVRKSPKSAEVLLSDTGFGVSQILPALVLCFYAPEGSTIILEQPEIHLHPFAQSGLADVFIDAWKKRNVQILVESHSEHLLNRLQRRIAEEEIASEDVSLFFCSEDEDGSTLTTLDVDQYGNIRNWPKYFFGDQFGEVTAMTKAGIKRRMEAG